MSNNARSLTCALERKKMPVVNYWAVIVAAISTIIVGSIWYGPLFGKIWTEGMGFTKMDPAQQAAMKKAMMGMYLQQFICSIVTAGVFAYILSALRIAMPDSMTGIMAGVQGGFWIWLGFYLPVKYGEKLWANKGFKLFAIDISYSLVMLVVMGMILASWA